MKLPRQVTALEIHRIAADLAADDAEGLVVVVAYKRPGDSVQFIVHGGAGEAQAATLSALATLSEHRPEESLSEASETSEALVGPGDTPMTLALGALSIMLALICGALLYMLGRTRRPGPPQVPKPKQDEDRRQRLPHAVLDQATRPQTHVLEEIEQEARDALQDHLDAGPHDDIGARLDRAFADEDL